MWGSVLVDLEDRKRRARLVRERFYAEAAERARTGASSRGGLVSQKGNNGHREAASSFARRNGRAASPAVEKVAAPCPGRNEGWLKGLTSRALSLAKVLASAVVPDAVHNERMAACRECAYSTKALGHHWCGCCGCPKWHAGGIGSSLEYKNKKAAWRCSRPDPAFGPWDG